MNTIKLMIVCLGVMLGATVSAQTVSMIPNWAVGDAVSYSFEQTDIKKADDDSSVDTKSMVLNLKVVDKNNDGYVINTTYQNPTSTDDMEQAMFKICENLSFDYKTDNSGKVIGLADSAKVVSDIKSRIEQVDKSDSTMASFVFMLQLAGAMMNDDMYLSGLLDKVGYIHSLNGLTLKSKKSIDRSTERATMFGFSAPITTHYTLKSAKGGFAQVKATSNAGNDVLLPAFLNFSMEMAQGVMTGMSGLFQDEKEDADMDQIMEQQRLELENKFKENFDLVITDEFKYSYDQSSQWISSMSGTTLVKGKVNGSNVEATIQINLEKK
ncbi:MAG: hypothetical protein PUG15_02790 [Bacteroidales bacterium]|nr:hypothetical protein [Bacteroidales bacterium]